MAVIYVLTNKANGKKYVGQTSCAFKKRLRSHIRESEINPRHPIHNAIRKYGIDNFDIEINEVAIDELNKKEMLFIKELKTIRPNGYNLTLGGDGMRGFKHSEESKKKMSNSRKGQVSYWKGKKMPIGMRIKLSLAHMGHIPWNKGKTGIYTEEMLQQMRESSKGQIAWNKGGSSWSKGKHLSEEHRKNIGIGNKGKTHTEEAKLKMSNWHKGKILSATHKANISKSMKKYKQEATTWPELKYHSMA